MYKIEIYPDARMHAKTLTPRVQAAFAEATSVLELVPWNGEPYNKDKPEGNIRQLVFGPNGEGILTYMILEDQQRVDVLQVQWID